jgi:hypothetical protein
MQTTNKINESTGPDPLLVSGTAMGLNPLLSHKLGFPSFPRKRDKSAQRVERPPGGPKGERSESSRMSEKALDSGLRRNDDGEIIGRRRFHVSTRACFALRPQTQGTGAMW